MMPVREAGFICAGDGAYMGRLGSTHEPEPVMGTTHSSLSYRLRGSTERWPNALQTRHTTSVRDNENCFIYEGFPKGDESVKSSTILARVQAYLQQICDYWEF